jgi:uncharacterized protein (TIGR02145 family)
MKGFTGTPYHRRYTMRKQLTKIALTATLGLAITFTLSCSGDDGNDNPPPESSSSSEPVWGAWAVTTPATCEAAGVETRTNDISQTETRPVAQLAWGVWTVTTPATCGMEGVETRTCPNNASPSETRQVAQLAWGEWTVTTPATCETAGVETRTCPNNASPSETRPIAQLEYDNTTELCDSRDGKIYKFVLIGSQTWMAKNLNYDVPGDDADVCKSTSADCEIYGRVYNWATAMNSSVSSTAVPSGVQGVCPTGWHLPSDAEWDALINEVGNSSGKLKSSTGWNTSTTYGTPVVGTNNYGFSALPGCYPGSISCNGDSGYWWSATEDNDINKAWYWSIYYLNPPVSRYSSNKTSLYSVRCVKDEN